jgi:hypothetical protein
VFTITATAFRLVAVAAVAAVAILGIVPGGMATAAAGIRVIPSVFPAIRVVRGAGTVTVAMAIAIARAMAMTATRHLLVARVIGAAAIVVLVIAIDPVFRGIFAVLRGEMVVLPGLAVFVGVGIVGEMVGSGAGGRGSGAGGAGSVGGVEGLAFSIQVGGGWGGVGFFEEAEGEPLADDRIGREVRRWFSAGGHGFASI